MTAGIATWRRIGWVAVIALAALGVAQWWLGNPPLALLAASYVAVLGLLTRALPLRIAVSAALLVQQAVLLGLVLVVPLVLGGPLRPGVALGMLLVPCLAVVPDVLRRRDDVEGPLRVPWSLVAAACVGGAVMVVTVLLAQRPDPLGAAAWTTSGDARNHYLFVRLLLAEGGLHGDAFSFQPLHQETLTALLLDTHGRDVLRPGELLEHDLRGIGQIGLALTVMWTLAGSAALLGLRRLRGQTSWVVLAVASLLPLTGVALGVLLRDGFLPILLLVPMILCTLAVLGWLCTTDHKGFGVTVAVGASAAALPVLAFTWTPHAVVVGCAALVPWWRALRGGEQRWRRLALMTAGAGSAAAYSAYVFNEAGRIVDAPGGIAAPSPVAVMLVPLLVLLIATWRLSSVPPAAFTPYLVGTIAVALVTAGAVVVQPDGFPWNYFPAKFAWVWLLAGLPLLLAPFAHPRAGSGRRLPLVVGALTVLVGTTALTTLASPVVPAAGGWTQSSGAPSQSIGEWTQPDAASLRLAVSLGHPRTRYVVFGVVPEMDRITNFWLVPHDPDDGPTRDNAFYVWAYYETGTAADICTLLVLQPYRVVATADPAAEQQLRQECGREVRVRVVRGPS